MLARVTVRSIRAALLAGTALTALPAMAQDATWLANPGSSNFNSAANWSPSSVPSGTAFFGVSNTTTVDITAATTLGGFTFNPGASDYRFNNGASLTFNGAGISVGRSCATALMSYSGKLFQLILK